MPMDIQHAFAEKGVEVITIPMNRTVFQPYKSLEHEYDWIFFH
jgi:uroporphyrinogen-III synthase